jgi:hypothetical protein
MSRALIWENDTVRDLFTVAKIIDDPTDSVVPLVAPPHSMLGSGNDHLVAWRPPTELGNMTQPRLGPPGNRQLPMRMAALRRYYDLPLRLAAKVLLDCIINERRAAELIAGHRRPAMTGAGCRSLPTKPGCSLTAGRRADRPR